MKRTFFFGVLILLAGATAFGFFIKNSKSATTAKTTTSTRNISSVLASKSAALKRFAAAQGYNARICFLIDMKSPAGQKRFFVYNMEKNQVQASGLVTHGSGGGSTFSQPSFSNKVGSNCTSLGRYRIGQQYFGQFGKAFKLHGLDKTNNNAFGRFVVLHAHDCVPTEETNPLPICMSWGCPTVAPTFLETLDGYISESSQPILLEIFNGK
jgi:hypothetical protein